MRRYNPGVEETWQAYDTVLKAVANKTVDEAIVVRAKKTLDDLRLTESAGNAGCMLSRMRQWLFCVLLCVGTMALGLVVCYYLPLEWTVVILGATAPGWLIEAALIAIYVAVLVIISAAITIPMGKFLLHEWIYAKIRHLKRATAKMPRGLMRSYFI